MESGTLAVHSDRKPPGVTNNCNQVTHTAGDRGERFALTLSSNIVPVTTSTEHVRSTAEHESILAIIVLVSEPAAAHSTP